MIMESGLSSKPEGLPMHTVLSGLKMLPGLVNVMIVKCVSSLICIYHVTFPKKRAN